MLIREVDMKNGRIQLSASFPGYCFSQDTGNTGNRPENGKFSRKKRNLLSFKVSYPVHCYVLLHRIFISYSGYFCTKLFKLMMLWQSSERNSSKASTSAPIGVWQCNFSAFLGHYDKPTKTEIRIL